MAPPGERPTTTLGWMLHVVPLVGVVTFGMSILGACISAIVLVSGWVVTLENLITSIQKSEVEEHEDIKQLQADMRSVDKRINEANALWGARTALLEAEVLKLHNESDAADAQMRARLDVIEALSKFAADRALAPPMPAPYRPTLQR